MGNTEGKIIVFSAPSGSGKSTILNYLLQNPELNLAFSISATNRPPRGEEKHGKEYYFLKTEIFREKISKNEFLEWEEVYPGRYYGTLKSEIKRLWNAGKNIVFDLDVKGGVNIKKIYPENTLSIFVKVPNIEELENRLKKRATDDAESIKARLERFEYELTFENEFDVVLINDDLEKTIDEAKKTVVDFLKN